MRRTALVLATSILIGVIAAPATASLPVDQASGLQLPVRARVDAPTQSLGYYVGRLEIPAIGVDEVIREGVDLSVIDRGVAHWAGTALPGRVGNLVLAGHRTIRTAPFLDLDLLEVGDPVYVTGVDGSVATYRVSETLIVLPTDMWIVEQTDRPLLTMFACHPKGSAKYRIVVRAELVDVPMLQFP